MVVFIILIFVTAFMLIPYLFSAIVTSIYASHHEVKGWGVAFLPIGREYVLGALADMYQDKKAKIWYPLVSTVKYIFSGTVTVYILSTLSSYFFSMSYLNSAESMFHEILNSNYLLFSGLSFLGELFSWVLIFVTMLLIIYPIAAFKAKNYAILWTFLSLLPFAREIFMLIYMNKPGMPFVPFQPVIQNVNIPVQVNDPQESFSNKNDKV